MHGPAARRERRLAPRLAGLVVMGWKACSLADIERTIGGLASAFPDGGPVDGLYFESRRRSVPLNRSALPTHRVLAADALAVATRTVMRLVPGKRPFARACLRIPGLSLPPDARILTLMSKPGFVIISAEAGRVVKHVMSPAAVATLRSEIEAFEHMRRIGLAHRLPAILQHDAPEGAREGYIIAERVPAGARWTEAGWLDFVERELEPAIETMHGRGGIELIDGASLFEAVRRQLAAMSRGRAELEAVARWAERCWTALGRPALPVAACHGELRPVHVVRDASAGPGGWWMIDWGSFGRRLASWEFLWLHRDTFRLILGAEAASNPLGRAATRYARWIAAETGLDYGTTPGTSGFLFVCGALYRCVHKGVVRPNLLAGKNNRRFILSIVRHLPPG